MQKKTKNVGRPPKLRDKLTRSINLKLSEMDYVNILTKAEKLQLSPTAYARQMAVNGCVKAPFTAEHLDLMRKLAGEANNLNQIAKHLNEGQGSYKLYACGLIGKLKEIVDDSKKY
ncbi:MAG: MobC family plasmid mobilization relaxosome protein [Rikenellaceae bacterium]